MPQQLATLSPALPDRAALQVELAHLKRRRGSSLIDGVAFDGARRLAEVEQSLLALEDDDAVAVQRERGAAGDAEQQRVAKLRAEITAADSERLAALADAEGTFSFVVEKLERVAALSEKIRVAGAQLQAPAQIVFDPRVVEKRLAALITPGLLRLGRGNDFGDIELRPGPLVGPVAAPWSELEARVSGHAVALLAGASASFNELHGPAEADSEPEDDLIHAEGEPA